MFGVSAVVLLEDIDGAIGRGFSRLGRIKGINLYTKKIRTYYRMLAFALVGGGSFALTLHDCHCGSVILVW